MADSSVVLLAAEGGNFLIPNGTFIFILLLFLIVLGVIAKWVVPPISAVLAEREAMIKQTVEDSRKAAEQFQAAEADYDAEMAKARAEASRYRDDARAEGRKILEDMRGRASEEAAAVVAQAEEQLKQQADAIAADLRASVDSLSRTLASRVLGVDVTTRTTPVSTGQER
ncbi:ATP synthase B/B' CF family protein [Mycolicibacterium hassiacum DSM 44199]|uniref:ATP synthase subunit b n=1 Tax=Mycolicibacterium hassiacum (strain DSM 44199 / CIP 105218 / JCM 12690 / 3849) TaxID=1122247 RepID=K5BEC8_MYCHD|nr:F0F1 ATP synthase subunit B [Mycolicibacterium hassiacum]EKF22882.1 ATP synthase B/B' CF family protein [Mycolicibacterium hassiacum DSM 44199]MBX5487932.1 F0F1 ATP synthase subunit B [Mycolicibacterium hassiacum]PZN25005.1 MAG: F0F1 ATP synthase subunit B [Mycolicibacterium hassiacum]